METKEAPVLSTTKYSSGPDSKIALLWDESFLWGLMAYKALKAARLQFELVRSEDINKGILSEYKLLFVPGGWASNKIKRLGGGGAIKIKEFVSNGGNYLGFCGGAGLATLDGIGLLNIRRKPTQERVPSFSGRIRLDLSEHPIWHGITEPVFHAWWPSQLLPDRNNSSVLATYGHAQSDSFSSDLNVGDTVRYSDWSVHEKHYGINLDPDRLLGDPAVVEGSCGDGKVLLSLVHFDTPGDENGSIVMRNLWSYLAGTERKEDAEIRGYGDTGIRTCRDNIVSPRHRVTVSPRPSCGTSNLVAELESAVDELIAFGQRNFLWFWRNPMLLQWRRGVRGLEYCTLYALIKEIAEIIKRGDTDTSIITDYALRIKNLLVPFVEKAEHLLILEKRAAQNGHITYEKCDDPEIRKIRTELFSNAKSHGGLFKELLDQVDALLYALL